MPNQLHLGALYTGFALAGLVDGTLPKDESEARMGAALLEVLGDSKGPGSWNDKEIEEGGFHVYVRTITFPTAQEAKNFAMEILVSMEVQTAGLELWAHGCLQVLKGVDLGAPYNVFYVGQSVSWRTSSLGSFLYCTVFFFLRCFLHAIPVVFLETAPE